MRSQRIAYTTLAFWNMMGKQNQSIGKSRLKLSLCSYRMPWTLPEAPRGPRGNGGVSSSYLLLLFDPAPALCLSLTRKADDEETDPRTRPR